MKIDTINLKAIPVPDPDIEFEAKKITDRIGKLCAETLVAGGFTNDPNELDIQQNMIRVEVRRYARLYQKCQDRMAATKAGEDPTWVDPKTTDTMSTAKAGQTSTVDDTLGIDVGGGPTAEEISSNVQTYIAMEEAETASGQVLIEKGLVTVGDILSETGILSENLLDLIEVATKGSKSIKAAAVEEKKPANLLLVGLGGALIYFLIK